MASSMKLKSSAASSACRPSRKSFIEMPLGSPKMMPAPNGPPLADAAPGTGRSVATSAALSERCIQLLVGPDHPVEREPRLDAAMAGLAHLPGQRRIVQRPLQRAGEGGDVLGGDQPA